MFTCSGLNTPQTSRFVQQSRLFAAFTTWEFFGRKPRSAVLGAVSMVAAYAVFMVVIVVDALPQRRGMGRAI